MWQSALHNLCGVQAQFNYNRDYTFEPEKLRGGVPVLRNRFCGHRGMPVFPQEQAYLGAGEAGGLNDFPVTPFSLLRVSIPRIARSEDPDLSKPQYQGRWHIHIRRPEATLL